MSNPAYLRRCLPPAPPKPRRKRGRPRTDFSGNSTADKGCGASHRALRRQWAARLLRGPIPCPLCPNLVYAHQRWHLAHADDPPGSPPGTAHRLGLYLNPPVAHIACNSATNRRRVSQQPPRTKESPALQFFHSKPNPQ